MSENPKCDNRRVKVMLLGVYHMEGSNKHVVDVEVDDVLSSRRQREIEMLVRGLARWKPEIIAVEFPHNRENELNAVYREYLDGGKRFDTETQDSSISARNEIVQIGFRLAKYLKHNRLIAIDWFPEPPEWMTLDMAKEVMNYRPQFSLLDIEKVSAEKEKKLRELTIGQYLRWLNSESMISLNDTMMIDIALEHPNRKAAFAIASNWFERNLGIVRNLKAALPSEIGRVLVIYGAGHIPMLWYIMEKSSLFCPISPLPYFES